MQIEFFVDEEEGFIIKSKFVPVLGDYVSYKGNLYSVEDICWLLTKSQFQMVQINIEKVDTNVFHVQ